VIDNTTPRVHNRYHSTAPDSAVYIGRPSEWGNPFIIGVHGDHDTVVTLHRQWVLDQPAFIQRIKTELKGKHLVCFCKPKSCHGDILFDLANPNEFSEDDW
jgi:Domain of unknown function (DUF4326)